MAQESSWPRNNGTNWRSWKNALNGTRIQLTGRVGRRSSWTHKQFNVMTLRLFPVFYDMSYFISTRTSQCICATIVVGSASLQMHPNQRRWVDQPGTKDVPLHPVLRVLQRVRWQCGVYLLHERRFHLVLYTLALTHHPGNGVVFRLVRRWYPSLSPRSPMQQVTTRC